MLIALVMIIVVSGLYLNATTHYIVEPGRLLIRCGGFVWMEIRYSDIEEMECKWVVFDSFRQIYMFQLGFRKMLKITKRNGFFRYVLLNPRDPKPIIEAVHRFRANLVTEMPREGGPPLPDFLRRSGL
jgi:hypothetical protein